MLAVLNSGITSDDSVAMFSEFADFEIKFDRHPRGIKLELIEAPAQAFVDGVLIETIHDHLFSILRDLMYCDQLNSHALSPSHAPTDLIFQILRHAQVFDHTNDLSRVVCWGGHAVGKDEYDYSQSVGRALGLRRFDICTGCGPGAMKGPMRGALLAHRRQHHTDGRFLGVTEPGIIAAEPPNGIASEIVIMPDIEKRLEAFVRLAHAIVIFPGGAGTFEEILYILAVLLDPQNQDHQLPVILTGPAQATNTLHAYLNTIETTLGADATRCLEIYIDDPEAVATAIVETRDAVRQQRIDRHDAYDFNWTLTLPKALQTPFEPTHENMARLNLSRNQSNADLAIQLRCLFSGIVAGNVKPETKTAIAENGPFQIRGDSAIIESLDTLLARLVDEQRMKIQGGYVPCYQLNATS